MVSERTLRRSTFLRERMSTLLTAETRGAPYKFISIGLAVGYICFGIRNIFFCGAHLPVGDGEALVMDMWKGCKEDKMMEVWEGLHGLGDLLVAGVRIAMATTASTANLYHTMIILGLYSIGFFVGAVRVGITDLALYYTAFMAFGLCYENYVMYLAYRAHRSRRWKREGMQETDGIPAKVLFLVLAVFWALFALKNFVACDSPYLLVDTDAERSLWSTWQDCRNSEFQPNIRIGWANMSGVHSGILAGIRVFCFTTPSIEALFRGLLLLNFYNIGTLFLLLRAGLDVLPFLPYLAVFSIGLVYEFFVLVKAYQTIEKPKEE